MEAATFIDGGPDGEFTERKATARAGGPTVIPVKLQIALWISSFLTALIAVIISVVSLKDSCVNVNVSSGSATGN